MNAGSLYQKRRELTATYDRLARQLAKGMYFQTEDIDDWSKAVTTAQRYDMFDLADALTALVDKPRHDAGRSVSKPGATRKAMAVDAFHALFIGGLA